MRPSARYMAVALAAVLLATTASAQNPAAGGQIIPLYAAGSVASLGVPETRERQTTGETMIFDVGEPTLELFRPAAGQANGTAVIVAPGGGFVGLGYTFGGTDVARALAQRGITAFVLKYRTIRSEAGTMHMPAVHLKEMDLVMARAKSGRPAEMPPFAGEPQAVTCGRARTGDRPAARGGVEYRSQAHRLHRVFGGWVSRRRSGNRQKGVAPRVCRADLRRTTDSGSGRRLARLHRGRCG